MARGIQRQVRIALENVTRDITGHSERGGLYALGLASEGYAGGYRDALRDVQLALRGVPPCVRPEYWRLSNTPLSVKEPK